jgi:hypothetical protein
VSEPILMPGTIDPALIAKSVHDDLDSAIGAIPAGHTHALFVDSTYSKTSGLGAQLTYVEKLNDTVEFSTATSYDGRHGVAGKVELLISW